MKSISHVTASLAVPTHRNGPLRGRDFADELRKADDRGPEIHSRHPAADGRGPHAAPAVVPPVMDGTRPVTGKAASVSSECEAMASCSTAGTLEKAGAQSAPRPNATVQPTGITEALVGSRVFGVHLFAGAYLSELYASTYDAGSPALSNAVPSGPEGMAAERHDVPPGAPSGTVSAMAVASTQDTETLSIDLFARTVAEAAGKKSRPAAAARLAPETSREVLWPEDSLRLTKQADGSVALWLRDYRMDDAQAARVADAMATEARARGMRLGKILWNGREVWTSPNEY
jgi:hypothetical protein